MAQMWIRAALLAAFAAVILAVSVVPGVTAQDKKAEKVPSIKQIMTAAHKGDDTLITKVKAAVQEGKWEDAQKAAKKLSEIGAALGKNKPKRGEASSWETLTKAYAESTKAVADATEKKDADATTKALDTISESCKTCHQAHKGKGK
jgi:cytochrome c556